MKREDGSPIHAASVEHVEFGRWTYPDGADPVRTPETGLVLEFKSNAYNTRVVVPMDVARSLLKQLREALGE